MYLLEFGDKTCKVNKNEKKRLESFVLILSQMTLKFELFNRKLSGNRFVEMKWNMTETFVVAVLKHIYFGRRFNYIALHNR